MPSLPSYAHRIGDKWLSSTFKPSLYIYRRVILRKFDDLANSNASLYAAPKAHSISEASTSLAMVTMRLPVETWL